MRRAAASGRRLASAFALLLALSGGTASAGANEVDESLLRIEAPSAALRAVRDAPEQISSRAEAPPETMATAVAAVNAAFDEGETLDVVRNAVARAGSGTTAPDFAEAANRFEATATEWDNLQTEGAAALAELKARFEARPDRERIVELAELMALPQLRGEVALATARIERMLDLTHAVGIKRLRDAAPAELAQDAQRFVAESRASGGDSAPHTFREFAVSEGEGWTTVRLALLSEADVLALHAFYASADGRAKRDALVASFAAQSDEDAVAMLLAFVEVLRAGPD